jgi:flagellum-specific peptidoglycan hydrolase FlgJ
MKAWLATILVIVLRGALASAQEAPNKSQLFTSDLIAWSAMQRPQEPEKQPAHQQPTPDPNPETQPAQNPTPSQPSSPSSRQEQSPSESQAPSPQTFTGTVSKDADNFVLKVSETASYKLDNLQQVQQYEGQRVRVTGTLDQSLNLIHVDRIEPLS